MKGRVTWYVVIMISVFAFPMEAHAIDMEYYAYGSFDTVVTAFQRLALIFSDNNYLALFASMIVLGILFGGTALYYKGLTGAQVSFGAWAIPLIVGVALFKALIIPTGTVHVYDQTRNEYQAVGGVPDAIVATAGVLNLIERSVVDVVDTASAYPYANEAGGITFELIYRATAEFTDIDDFYVTKTVGRYFLDCSPVALTSNAYPVDDNEIKRGTTDLLVTAADMRSATVTTVAYTPANKAGVTVTCQDAWDLYINPVLTNPATFDNAVAVTCGKAGFNVNSVNQLNACKNLMARAAEIYTGVAGGSYIQFIRNTYLAQAIDRAMQEANPDLAQRAIANRNLMVQGIGVGNTANEWLPSLRGVMMALALGMVPVLALFIVTPLMTKAVVFTLGLLGWMTLWGITDAVVHQMAMDGAQTFFDQVERFQYGLDAIWLSPEASAKALALFGKVRSMGVMMATVLAFALYRFGGYAFANIAESFTQQMQQAGSEAAIRTATPQGRADTMSGLAGSVGTHANRSMHSLNEVSNASYMEQARNTSTGQQLYAEARASGGGGAGSVADTVNKLSAMTVGDTMGALHGVMGMARYLTGKSEPTSQDVINTKETMASIETAMRAGEAYKAQELMKDFSPTDDVYEGAAKYATIRALSQYKGYEKTGELLGKIQEFNAGMSKEQAAYELASYELASKEGAIEATKGNVAELTEFFQTRTAWDVSEWQGLKTVADRFEGISMSDLASASGNLRTYQASGNVEAIRGLSHEELAAASAYNTLTGSLNAAAKMNLAEQYSANNDQSLVDTMREAGVFNSAREMGLFYGMAEWAQKTGGDVENMAFENFGGQFSLKVDSKDEWERQAGYLRRHGLWNPDMERVVAANGYNAVMDVSYDPSNSTPLSVGVRAGHETRMSHSVTEDRSVTARGENRIDAGAFAELLENPQAFSGTLTRTMQVAMADKNDGHYDTREVTGLLSGFAALISTRGSATDTHVESFDKSSSQHTKGGLDLDWVPVVNASAGVSASLDQRSSNSEQQLFNTAVQLASSNLTSAIDTAEQAVRDNHPDIDIGSPEYIQQVSTLASEKFVEYSKTAYHDFIKKGREAAADNNEWVDDTNDKIKEEKEKEEPRRGGRRGRVGHRGRR